MSDQYQLVGLGNSELLAGLSELVRQSNSLTGVLLAHLVELEERKLYLELGFSSLFAYCVEALGMSEGTAGRRVTAARVCRRFPQLFERVARGELHLCALCALAPHLDLGNAAELFDLSVGKTRRQVEELLAARFPRPDVREQIRRLPARTQVSKPVEAVEIAAPQFQAVELPSSPLSGSEEPATVGHPGPIASGAKVSDARPRPRPRPRPRQRSREVEPLSADRYGVHFTADAELRDLIERARALASHRLPNGDLAGLMKLMAASFVLQEEKRRFGVGAKPRRVERAKATRIAELASPPGGVAVSSGATKPGSREARTAKRGRYLSVAVRRAIHDRDRGRCAYVSADGRRCDARAFLEFDHVIPHARRGSCDAPNIRLLCKAHNLLHARHCFGAMHVSAKIAAGKRQQRGSGVHDAQYSRSTEPSAASRVRPC